AEPGPLKDLVDMAWQAVKAKLVRGVSIGFRALGYEPLESGGLKFTETAMYERSPVCIPAHATATIQTIEGREARHLDGAVRLIRARDQHIRNGAVAIQKASS